MNKCAEFIDTIGTAKVQEFIGTRSAPGIYIPAYQRRFSWSEKEYRRFFEDVAYEIRTEQDSYCTLLGNIVCFNDSLREKVEDGIKEQQPTPLYNVVDGQQRVSFIAILAVALHKFIDNERSSCENNSVLTGLLGSLKTDLENIFSVHLGDRKSPKVIRALEDVWGEPQEEKYQSPIARYIKHYIDTCVTAKKPFGYDTGGLEGQEETRHKQFIKNLGELDKLVSEFCLQDSISQENFPDAMKIPPVPDLLGNEILMKKLFDIDVKGSRYEAKDHPMFRAATLGYYLCRCVCLIVLSIKDYYDKSFTVFSAINTAGKLLNAFETFVPEVVRFESKYGKYRKSDSYRYIEKITKDLEEMDGKSADTHVKELMIAFALSYSGYPLSLELYHQQKYLKQEFDKLQNKEEKRRFVEFMYHVHKSKMLFEKKRFTSSYITKKDSCPESWKKHLEPAVFCLKFLNRANFKLSVAVFARYLYNMRINGCDQETVKLFCLSVMKTASFCALWRAASQASTSGIDDSIRKLRIMGHGDIAKGRSFLLTEEELDADFQHALREKHRNRIKQRDGWKQSVNLADMSSCNHVARFILLVGSNNKDIGSDLKTTDLRNLETNKTIGETTFESGAYATIEHIIPLQESGDHPSGLEPAIKNQLWNLTLLPRKANASASNNPWHIKQRQYAVFSSESKKEYAENLKELEKVRGDRPRLLKNKLTEHEFSHMTKYLALLKTRYTKAEGLKRVEPILDHCWDTLAEEWLKWSRTSNGAHKK